MGTVYLAAVKGGGKVAIKELARVQGNTMDRELAEKQFAAEADLLQSLSHPGLVKVEEVLREDSGHFLVMEYIDGMTLAQFLGRLKGFLKVEQVLHIGAQIAAVLEYLHGLDPPVIFRDLKPSNVMIDRNYKVRLIDFGIARHFTDDTCTQTFLKGVGSAGYAPLEQYGAGTTDPRSDIYALGATLYTLLTKEIPPSVVSLVAGVESLRSIHSLNSDVPSYLEATVARMMGLRKEQRFDSVSQLLPLLLNPPSDDEDPTGTLELARQRAALTELGPCLVCKRIGPDLGPFLPRDCPLALVEIRNDIPVTIVLGLKSEVDAQSGIHFQKGEKRKHASRDLDLGYKGAAALFVSGSQSWDVDGERMLEMIRLEFPKMALYLLEQISQLDQELRLASIPVLEALADKTPGARLAVMRAVYETYLMSLGEENELLQSQRERLRDYLFKSGEPDEARKLNALSLDWNLRQSIRAIQSGSDSLASAKMRSLFKCCSKSAMPQGEMEELLAKLSDEHKDAELDPHKPFRIRLQQCKEDGDVMGEALIYLLQARGLAGKESWQKAKGPAEKAMGIAEAQLGEQNPELFDYMKTLSDVYENIQHPDRLEAKSRALILKYKGKKK